MHNNSESINQLRTRMKITITNEKMSEYIRLSKRITYFLHQPCKWVPIPLKKEIKNPISRTLNTENSLSIDEVLPIWARPYFALVITPSGEVRIKFNCSTHYPETRDIQRIYFAEIKKALRKELEVIADWHDIDPDTMRVYAQKYTLCNLALGMIDQKKAALAKQDGTKPDGNDGTNRQHWVPELYLKQFAKNKRIQKFNKITGQVVPVKLLDEDFVEKEDDKGNFYLPQYEIILSHIETDYGFLIKHKVINESDKIIHNAWDFLVAACFFLTFEHRTNGKRDTKHPEWNRQIDSLFLEIPYTIARVRAFQIIPTYNLEIKNENEEVEQVHSFRMPFTQHPILKEVEYLDGGKRIFSFWGIHSPDILLWFRNIDSNYGLTQPYDFGHKRIMAMLSNESTNFLYFHPDDAIWAIYPLDKKIDFLPTS